MDPCDAPLSVTPTVLGDQEYTITQPSFDYTFVAFTADPSWCATSYSYSVTQASGDDATAFNDAALTFTFFEPTNNLDLSGSSFKDYVITVVGTSGDVLTLATGIATFSLRIENPCIDPSYVTITEAALVAQTFILFDNSPLGLMWTHDAFILNPDPQATALCGGFTYTATFDGQQITSSSSPMSHDNASRAFSFYSEDFGLIGSHTFTIEAFLTDYTTVATLPLS